MVVAWPFANELSLHATENTSKPSKLRIIKNVTVLSLSVFLVFLAYDCLAMLQSTMNHEGGIGVWSQAILYFCFCISSLLFPPYVIKKIGSKLTYAVSILLYVPFIASNFYPQWTLMFPASVIVGVAAPLLWGAQANYLNDISVLYADIMINAPFLSFKCRNLEKSQDPSNGTSNTMTFEMEFRKPAGQAGENGLQSANHSSSAFDAELNTHSLACSDICSRTEDLNSVEGNEVLMLNTNSVVPKDSGPSDEKNGLQKDSLKLPVPLGNSNDIKMLIESTTARIFGIHGFAFLNSHIWSNLMSYFVLKADSSFSIPANLSCVCGAHFDNAATDCLSLQSMEQPSDYFRNVLNSICVSVALLSALVVFLFLDALQNDEEEAVSFSFEKLTATCKFMRNKKCLLLVPMSFYLGATQGFYSSDFNQAYVGCAWGTYHVSLVAACYGVTGGVSSIASGWLVKRLGRIPIFSFATFVTVAVNVALLFWQPDAGRMGNLFLVAGSLGIYNGIAWSQLRAFFGVLFKADEEVAFASFHAWNSLGFGISLACSIYLWNYIKIYLMLAVAILSFACYIKVEKLHSKEKVEE